MKNYKLQLTALSLGGLFLVGDVFAANPLIMDQFTADPAARVFEGKIYLYPSHDIPVPPGSGARTNWFCMEDYHVFSSENLVDWTDHGVICNQTNVPWLNRKSYSMWAPDCVFKNGKYYFYFPTGGRIGVATSEKPYGPWKVEEQPVTGAGGIDPCVLIDKDGSAYLFTSMNRIMVGKLKDNMLELEGRAQTITNLPTPGLLEGPFVFERNGTYYLTYPHAVRDSQGREAERLEYSISTNVLGPYTWAGIITDQSQSGCWTEHHSIVEFKGQWYLFYHDKDLSPNFDKNRSARADKLFFNQDGTIQKVIPTLRGVGIVDARSKIQIDRYSAVSKEGTSVSFLDETNKFAGWKISLKGKSPWVQFNEVDLGKDALRSVNVRAVSSTGGTVEIHLDKLDGPLLAKVEVGKGPDWKVIQSKMAQAPTGMHNLVVIQNGEGDVELDWVSFE